ncbi:MAG: filamentous hemagglutinin N-terminal domain-containing protein, partial [Alphaproteobacteria bacterium]|nr:filamentous hemagglutinin N-terminal domain-containing protein [Alphaproteobacteria bacterium]
MSHIVTGSVDPKTRFLKHRLNHKNQRFFKSLAGTVALSALLSLTAQRAEAAPTGFSLVSGSVEAPVTSAAGKTMTITQRSNRGVIEWTDFDVASDETVAFNITNAAGVADPSGATLNRITGGASSSIRGTVTSNGTLYFVNPN